MLTNIDYMAKLSHSVREEVHYKLKLENYEEGAKVFIGGAECRKIMIVVKGELELIVEHHSFDFHLELLGIGSVLGAYSIINESQYQFSGKARTPLSLLVLDRDDLIDVADKVEEVTDSIEVATQFIIDGEVPLCDFTVNAGSLQIAIKNKRTKPVVERFKNAVRRLRVLNRRKQMKPFKLYELINFIRSEKRRLALLQANQRVE